MNKINSNPVHNKGKSEESLNSMCLNDQAGNGWWPTKKLEYKTEDNIRFEELSVWGRLDSTEK